MKNKFLGAMSVIFILAGALELFSAFAIQPESSIHQIYQQIEILTGAILFGFAFLIIAMNEDKKEEKPEKNIDEKK